jgi:hypothetical protein
MKASWRAAVMTSLMVRRTTYQIYHCSAMFFFDKGCS